MQCFNVKANRACILTLHCLLSVLEDAEMFNKHGKLIYCSYVLKATNANILLVT